MKTTAKTLLTSAFVLAAASQIYAQEKPAAPTATATTNTTAAAALTNTNFFTGTLPEAFTKGKFNFNARLRYEYADQSNLQESYGLTIRPRFGFTTAPVYGFQTMIEAENVTAITDYDKYNAGGSNGQPGRTAIADPETTEINQAWLSYSNWDTTLKGGRQRIFLDNHRFVGDVGWRQNMQTYDAISLENKSIEDVTLFYSYVFDVNRVFGDVSGLPAANQDFESDSHFIHASYNGFKLGKITAYSYLLDFENSPANSSATYGLSFVGGYTFDKDTNTKINYRAEYAHQTDYQSSLPVDYAADYYVAELGGEYRMLNAGAGYEVLGSDDGTKGFATPLATLHAFNGWADVFLNTPAVGLQDMYVWVGAKLPGNIPIKAIYHKFEADSGSADFGDEWDFIVSRQFGKNWTALIKYAYYNGKDAPAAFDVQKLWAQVEFNF